MLTTTAKTAVLTLALATVTGSASSKALQDHEGDVSDEHNATLHMFPASSYPTARCLDGSQFGVFVRPAPPNASASSKAGWLVVLNGQYYASCRHTVLSFCLLPSRHECDLCCSAMPLCIRWWAVYACRGLHRPIKDGHWHLHCLAANLSCRLHCLHEVSVTTLHLYYSLPPDY